MDKVAQTEAAFAALAKQYQARKRLSESSVREWQWATWCRFQIKPLYFERHGWAPGRSIRTPPADPKGHVSYGMDENGRVAVERDYNEFGFYETFYDWSADSPEVARFDYSPKKAPISLVVAYMNASRIVECHEAAISGYSLERYRWDGDLVAEVNIQIADRSSRKLGPLRPYQTVQAQYDTASVLQRVEVTWAPAPPDRPEILVRVPFERRDGRILRRRT